MKVKQRVLQELEGKKGEFVSGEQLAEQLGVLGQRSGRPPGHYHRKATR